MLSDRHALTFNVKAVVRATGLTADTLRAWERRYGLPQPPRSAGGHRLYSQYHVDILKWLIARRREGMSISRAVEFWRSIEAQHRDPLADEAHRPAAREGHSPEALRDAWISACLAFDEGRADAVLSEAFALYPPEAVCVEVLQRGVAALGDGWLRGDVSVQQEHFATALATRWLDRLIALATPALRPGRVLVCCPPDEQHALGPLLFVLLLRRRGVDALFLGASVPLEQLDQPISALRPRVIVLVAQRLPTSAGLLEAARLLGDLGVTVAYGGRPFNASPALRAKVPGVFLGEDLRQATSALERLLEKPPGVVAADPLPEAYETALAAFRLRRPAIEAAVWEQLVDSVLPSAELALANAELGDLIAAGLRFGALSVLDADLSWLRTLLATRHVSAERLRAYLGAYTRAAARQLDGRASPVVEWLEATARALG